MERKGETNKEIFCLLVLSPKCHDGHSQKEGASAKQGVGRGPGVLLCSSPRPLVGQCTGSEQPALRPVPTAMLAAQTSALHTTPPGWPKFLFLKFSVLLHLKILLVNITYLGFVCHILHFFNIWFTSVFILLALLMHNWHEINCTECIQLANYTAINNDIQQIIHNHYSFISSSRSLAWLIKYWVTIIVITVNKHFFFQWLC